jgi:hypothetical protein
MVVSDLGGIAYETDLSCCECEKKLVSLLWVMIREVVRLLV